MAVVRELGLLVDEKEARRMHACIWCLDAYFLRLEKLYRELYDWLISNRLSNDTFLLDMSRDRLEERFGNRLRCTPQIMFSKTLIVFYGFLLFVIVFAILVDFYTGALSLSTT
jgi:hypothetical protein